MNAKREKESREKEAGAINQEDAAVAADPDNDEDFDMSWLGRGRNVSQDGMAPY